MLDFAWELNQGESIVFDAFLLHLRTNRSLWPRSDNVIYDSVAQFVARSLVSRGIKDLDTARPLLGKYVIPAGRLTAPVEFVLNWPPDYIGDLICR